MRTGGCTIQQSLTPETATIVKQAIHLARTRGHAQVTPIHIASVMLASPRGLLRAACLKSYAHPLQCKALELCFNVALNRLPTTTPAPILSVHSHFPALANALMAAFKRAQAHQRRGSIETQQQPILALKIEIEQLVISILDDPSVSRVMKEAGFSSTHVKSNVENVVSSLENASQNSTISTNTSANHIKNEIISPLVRGVPLINQYEVVFSKPNIQPKSEDVSSVINSWGKKIEKKSFVLVGECLTSCESVIRGVKERIEKGEEIPFELKYVQFLNCPLSSMKNLSREEIDMKLGEIRYLLKSCIGRGVVLYLGDLQWVVEDWAYYGEQRKHYYCPVEHLVMGLWRLVFGNMEISKRLWLMGIASFHSYMKCKSGIPSLESLLDLNPLTIPAGNLDLSLNLDSSLEGQNNSNVQLNCCMECSANCHQEMRSLAGTCANNNSYSTTTTTTTTVTSTSSSLPSWLRKCKVESSPTHDELGAQEIRELYKKWNSICSSAHNNHKTPEKSINFSSYSPSSLTSISSYEHNKHYFHETKPISSTWSPFFEPKWALKEHQFLSTKDFFEQKPEILSNPNSTPNSATSSEATETPAASLSVKYNDNNPQNFEALCYALEQRVPWQKDIIPEIATTVLRIRSGMMSRKKSKTLSMAEQKKLETWLIFLGVDSEGKLAIARELSRLIFGSHSCFRAINLRNSLSTRADSSDYPSSKRARLDSDAGYLERFAESVRENPHRVFYLEDFEQIDHGSKKGIKQAIKTGEIKLSDGGLVPLEDAIVIFSCESFSSGSRACSPPAMQKVEDSDQQESLNVALDLNIGIGDGDDDNDDDDDDDEGESSVGDLRILELVDKQVFFKVQVLL